MRALGFVFGMGVVMAFWYWRQMTPAPVDTVAVAAAEEEVVAVSQNSNFGSDVGDFGEDTSRAPPPHDWVVKPAAAQAEKTESSWLVITRPFSSETSARAFSEALAQETGLSLSVQNPAFREYQVAVVLDGKVTRDRALATLNEHYAWMQFK